jgi:hypothetical protein
MDFCILIQVNGKMHVFVPDPVEPGMPVVFPVELWREHINHFLPPLAIPQLRVKLGNKRMKQGKLYLCIPAVEEALYQIKTILKVTVLPHPDQPEGKRAERF